MSTASPSARRLRTMFRGAADALDRGVDEAQIWLSTPTGRRVRSLAAKLLIVSAPLVMQHPFFKTPLGRVVAAAGGAAVLIKVAELIRDWELEPLEPFPPPA